MAASLKIHAVDNTTMRIRDLKGLGPNTELLFATIDINTVEDFHRIDAYDLFVQLKKLDASTSLNLLYSIIGAKENCHWQEIVRTRKTEILIRLDDLGLAP
jgi:DNA transformation protein